MPHYNTDDLRIEQGDELLAPMQLMRELKASDDALATAFTTRKAIHDVLRGADDRLLVVVGPCSIHDYKAAIEYGTRLKAERERLAHDLIIVMRVYFEKPRTTVGWKGFINDPHLDESFDINEGLRVSRKLLLELANMGMPAATEYLDLISPQYIADLIAWGAIGARTTESQTHRQLASGLSCPVGFKNGTDGTIKVAVDAIKAAASRHHFISVTKSGHVAVFKTSGNEDTHIILRGGKTPNYDAASIDSACKELAQAGLKQSLMVDCSHANASKNHERQMVVATDVCNQLAAGESRIMGVMVESHLAAGRQDLVAGEKGKLAYGQSITDACIGWEDTVRVLDQFAAGVRARRLTLQD
jgi:3-deoxy-7-phosphoheptulonate synthase